MIAAAATTDTAPWWYVAALAGGFTLLGGLISLFSTFFSDRRKLKHEDKRRWDKDIITIVSSLITTSGKMRTAFTEFRGDLDEGSNFIESFQREVSACRERSKGLDLIAPRSLCESADTLVTSMADLLQAVATDREGPSYKAILTAENKLRHEARRDLDAKK